MKYFSLIAISLFALVVLSCSPGPENAAKNTFNVVKFLDTALTQLPNNQVCMVNNRFMNAVQIAVPVKGKTYYGCCEACVKTLKEDSTSRFITDPLSGERVDKATAFIIGKPGSKEDVLYFTSQANAKAYFDKYLKRKQ